MPSVCFTAGVAAKERDDVFASICFCSIIDLEHADMAYEWLFQDTDSRLAGSEEQQKAARVAIGR